MTFWRTKTGDEIEIKVMSDTHLINSKRLKERNNDIAELKKDSQYLHLCQEFLNRNLSDSQDQRDEDLKDKSTINYLIKVVEDDFNQDEPHLDDWRKV